VDNPLQFLILTPFGTGEWKTTPVYTNTEEFPLVSPTGPVGAASVNLGFKLVSRASQDAAEMCCTNSTWDIDGFWHPTEEEGRHFWALWWKGKELRNISPLLDPFAPNLPSAPAQPFGGQRTVDVETLGLLWGESDVGPDASASPAPPLISVLTPTASPAPTYDVQIFWRPFNNDAWEASVKLRVDDEMPEFNLGEGGAFTRLDTLSAEGIKKLWVLAPQVTQSEPGQTLLTGPAIADLIKAWRSPPTPPKPVLTWEEGKETLRTLVVGSYQVLTEAQKAEVSQLYDDFNHFSAIKERYPNLPYFMIINVMQRTLDSILG